MPFPETPLPPVIVPAAPDARLVGFSLDADGATIDWTMTIIAWRIVLDADGLVDEVEPVCAETLPEVWCLRECHDGVPIWRFPEDRDCDSLTEARSHAASLLAARTRRVRP
jgi:hypothetical protein